VNLAFTGLSFQLLYGTAPAGGDNNSKEWFGQTHCRRTCHDAVSQLRAKRATAGRGS